MANKGHPSEAEAARRERGAPTVVSYRLSPTAKARIAHEAERRGISASALIELYAMGLPEADDEDGCA